MKRKILIYSCLLSTIPSSIFGIYFLYENNKQISNSNNIKTNTVIEFKNRLATAIFSKEHIIDVSDLNLTEQEILNVWSYFEEKLTALFPYLNLSTSQSVPKNFIRKENNKIVEVDASYKDYDSNNSRSNAVKMAENFYNIIKFAPINKNKYNMPFYIYQRVVDWYRYKNTVDTHYLYYGLLNNTGVCETYSKLSMLMFNSFNINAAYISGVVTSGIPGPHVWNQYEINGKWFNFDSTFGDGSVSTSGDIKSTPANPEYIAFPNTFKTSTREYHNNWWKPRYNADVDMAPYANYVPYNKEISSSRKYPFNDKWYYIKGNQIIKSNIDYSDHEEVYSFLDQTMSTSRLGMWSLGDKLVFVDKDNDKYKLMSIDLNSNSINMLKEYDEEIIKVYINNSNEIIVDTKNETSKVKLPTTYNFLNQNNIESIKSLAVINSLWFNSIQIGFNTGELLREKFIKHFNKLEEALNAPSYSNDLKQEMIDFKKNVEIDLNNRNIPNVKIALDNEYAFNEYDDVEIEPEIQFTNSTSEDYEYIWQEYSNNNWIDTKHYKKNLVINKIENNYSNKRLRLKCSINDIDFISNETTIIVNSILNPQLNLSIINNPPFNYNAGDKFNFKVESTIINNRNESIDISNKYKYDLYLNGKMVSSNVPNNIVYTLSAEDSKNKTLEFYVKINNQAYNIESNKLTFDKTPISSVTYNGTPVYNNEVINLSYGVNDFPIVISIIKNNESVDLSFEYDASVITISKNKEGLKETFEFNLKENKTLNTNLKLLVNNNPTNEWNISVVNNNQNSENSNKTTIIILSTIIPIICVLLVTILLFIFTKKRKAIKKT